MNIKFCTNSISTKTKLPTLSDIVKAAHTKVAMSTSEPVTKVASAAAVAPKQTVAKGDFCFDCKKPKAGCKCKKDNKDCASEPAMASSKKTTKVAEEGKKDEGKDSGQPKAEAKLVNKPELPEGDKKAKSSSGSSESEEGESSGQLAVEPLHQKGESTQEKPGSLDTGKSEKGEKTDKKEAQSVLHAFVKVANLTAKQKEFLRKTWSLYYPPSFIDALLADR